MPQIPQFNAPQMQQQAAPQQNPQLQAIISQLQAQAAQSNSVLSDQANQQIAAQRAVMERQTGQGVTRSLAANGLLPTGGQSARMEQQLRQPMEEQLASYGANVNQNLQTQRNGTANNLLQQLTALQGQDRAGQFDQQRFALDQQRAQYDMQMTNYNAQVRASESAYQRAMDQYNQSLTQRQQGSSSSSGGSGGYASGGGGGGGGGTSVGASINAGQNSFLDQGRQPRDVYNNMLANDRAQQQRNSYQYTGGTGNGVSSAGSSTGVSMNGPLVGGSGASGGWNPQQSAQSQQGFGVGGMYPTPYGGNYGNPYTDNVNTGGWGA